MLSYLTFVEKGGLYFVHLNSVHCKLILMSREIM